MKRGKQINISPVDDATTYKDYYYDPDLGWMPTKEYLDSILKPLMTTENGFKKEVDKITALGINELQAGCYISNYHDDYICDKFNGGCKNKNGCDRILNMLRKED